MAANGANPQSRQGLSVLSLVISTDLSVVYPNERNQVCPLPVTQALSAENLSDQSHPVSV